jgi:hypothetical protein
MGEVIPFKKPRPSEKFQGRSLCRDGLHKWVITQEKQFDVKRGKLVTVYRCSRCGKQKVEAV